MPTKQAALHNFLNSAIPIAPRVDEETGETLNFLPFYPVGNIPEYAAERFTKGWSYGTYTRIDGNFDSGPVFPTLNLWAYTTQEKPLNDMAAALSKAIGYGGTTILCDEGLIWIRRGSPWCQSLTDDADDHIKRRYINLTIEYETPD